MKKQFVVVGVLACLFTNINSHAQQKEKSEKLDEVVVTATKFKTNKKNIGRIVQQITAQDIENNQGKTIVDFLNDLAGVEINGNYSNRGQNLGYYIRGGRNRQVAILIDGINVNDPSSFSGDFDLRQIDINQVERIEVIKGASSTLYGTGAATGVINIILKKASKKGFSGTFTTSVGSNRASQNTKLAPDEFSANFSFSGTVDKIDYMLSLNSNNSSGLSASENENKNIINREDKFSRQNALIKVGFNATDKVRIVFFGSYDEFRTEFDGFEFDPVTFEGVAVDQNNSFANNQRRFGLTADYKYNKGELKVRTTILNINRDFFPSNDIYKGDVYGFDVFNNYKINSEFSFITGVAGQYQDMLQSTSFSAIPEGEGKQHFFDPYISVNYNSTYNFNINVGGRLNIHNEYGNNFVYNINPSYNFNFSEKNNVKVFASYSTAFVTPTLAEIFNKLPSVDELQPEKDVTIEGGFELALADKLTLNGTYFYREETDKIGFDPSTFQSINDLGTFLARGIETEITYKPIKDVLLRGNYTYIDREESLLLKIPQHKFGVAVDYKPFAKTNTSLSYKFVDETTDFGNAFLDSYSVLDFFVNHTLYKDKVTLFGSVTNILNEDYQEIAGFSTRGRNINVGLKIRF
ncbi:TonB-dependent receptor plug domain-containing protein [Tenacibaculum jejuense]|uniref:Probable TonB-dependent outer membrane receptor n=1 Tax=Tenacibaculum jejuense TaxID=584609 RepID=A0A238UCT4_9FLAO|nr:TonB-dependent receptor [Tenacibaculum jejuense]SNR16200.1 Probable TonB-dependent outer membrane receptor precursor [Tenacibaculum jejuense]